MVIALIAMTLIMGIQVFSRYVLGMSLSWSEELTRYKAAFKVVNHTFELILFLYLIPFAWKFFMSAVVSGQTSPALNLPMYYVQVAPLFSFVLVAFRIAQRWWIELMVVLKKEKKGNV